MSRFARPKTDGRIARAVRYVRYYAARCLFTVAHSVLGTGPQWAMTIVFRANRNDINRSTVGIFDGSAANALFIRKMVWELIDEDFRARLKATHQVATEQGDAELLSLAEAMMGRDSQPDDVSDRPSPWSRIIH